jgi:serine kinase
MAMNSNHSQLMSDQGYDYIGDIGSGAYADVNLFWAYSLKKTVAIKIINKNNAARDFVKNFLPREIDILQKVKHPNIISVYEILATSDGRVFIVIQYAPYCDLLHHVQRYGGLSETQAKHLFGNIVEAVDYLHKNNIVHRDLKCENLLLTLADDSLPSNESINLQKFIRPTADDIQKRRSKNKVFPKHKINQLMLEQDFDLSNVKCVVTDFGFSKIMKCYDEVSRSFCGSAAYAAPEILRGEPYPIRSHDQWSLGIILYVMVCGNMPFDDSNVRAMIKQQMNVGVKFTPAAADRLSDQIKDLIRKLTEPNCQKRYNINQVQSHPWLINRLRYNRKNINRGSNDIQSGSNIGNYYNNNNNSDVQGSSKEITENNESETDDKVLDAETKKLTKNSNKNKSKKSVNKSRIGSSTSFTCSQNGEDGRTITNNSSLDRRFSASEHNANKNNCDDISMWF